MLVNEALDLVTYSFDFGRGHEFIWRIEKHEPGEHPHSDGSHIHYPDHGPDPHPEVDIEGALAKASQSNLGHIL